MRTFFAIAGTGVTAARLHPLRTGVTVACLVAALLPYLAGIGLARGSADQADVAARTGADLYVSAEQFGRPAPIPVAAADEVRKIPGVVSVTPRIVGHIELGKDKIPVILIGIPV